MLLPLPFSSTVSAEVVSNPPEIVRDARVLAVVGILAMVLDAVMMPFVVSCISNENVSFACPCIVSW